MAWLDSFRGLLDNGEQDEKRVVAGLRDIHRGFVERARRLDLTADRAPSESAESDLRRVVGEHRETAGLVVAALQARNSSPRGIDVEVASSTGTNHWARIVEDLEYFQQGRYQILEYARDLIDLDPDLTDLFDALTRRMNEQIAGLRGEIAQADPQALN